MSTGKRIAKRSIIGTRVCAPGEDRKYYSGVIQAVKTPANSIPETNTINLTPSTRYTVKFDSRQGTLGRTTAEFLESQLIGPGFQSVLGTELVPGQKCFVTYNGREVAGEVCKHYVETDEVIIRITACGTEEPFEVQKRLEEVRLMESRKSARLADSDTDFARLADMASGERKRTSVSNTIDVPAPTWSRKRRPSHEDDLMDDCSAALVLMSLSCSPQNIYGTSPGSSSLSSSGSLSLRSTPSPPPTNNAHSFTSDEGIVIDFNPRKKKSLTRVLFQCTYRGCQQAPYNSGPDVEDHVRTQHNVCRMEEEFYYTEIEVGVPSPGPTLSHLDMARPFHEDPEYQRKIVGTLRQSLLHQGPINIPQAPHNKIIKLSGPKPPFSPRRSRGENKKCRKVYGMEHRELWCTQCKWKKACSRFGD